MGPYTIIENKQLKDIKPPVRKYESDAIIYTIDLAQCLSGMNIAEYRENELDLYREKGLEFMDFLTTQNGLAERLLDIVIDENASFLSTILTEANWKKYRSVLGPEYILEAAMDRYNKFAPMA